MDSEGKLLVDLLRGFLSKEEVIQFKVIFIIYNNHSFLLHAIQTLNI
jgi:hypothetical protein